MKHSLSLNQPFRFALLATLLSLAACTSVVVDEHRTSNNKSVWQAGEKALVLGRRHSSNYETEPDLVKCVGERLQTQSKIEILDEMLFLDELYPWFEPRTAPLRVKDMNRILQHRQVVTALQDRKLRFLIWIDGATETTNSAGSIGCAISVGGGGCFGFGSWEKESDYRATVWDLKDNSPLGEISADASGTSYMPAVVVPIPIIARVQKNACEAMAKQLNGFFGSTDVDQSTGHRTDTGQNANTAQNSSAESNATTN